MLNIFIYIHIYIHTYIYSQLNLKGAEQEEDWYSRNPSFIPTSDTSSMTLTKLLLFSEVSFKKILNTLIMWNLINDPLKFLAMRIY